MGHLNVRSILSVADEIHCLLVDKKIDVLTVSETWLDSTISTSEFCPSGYEFIRKDRDRKGGGVGIYIYLYASQVFATAGFMW